MQKSEKTSQYTFGEKEQQILEILASFENELQEKLQETKSEIERVKYYEKFKMQGIDFQNIFITEEKDVDGNISYHIYAGDASNEIISINENGEVNIIPGLESFIENDIDIQKIMEENEKEPGKLRGISEKAKPKEIDEKLKENKEEQENEFENVEELSEELEDLELTNYRKIKDDNLDKQMKGKFKGAEEKGTAYSKKLNAFIIVEKVDGKLQKADGFEPAKPTMKKVISINEDGTEVEQTVPHALIKTDNPKKELSITIGQYGYIETATVDRLPCNERVQMELRQDGEGKDAKRSKELQDMQLKGGREAIHEIAHAFKDETKNEEDKSTSIDELESDTGYEENNEQFQYSDDEERKIEEEAKKDKISVEEFKRYLEQTEGNTLDEKIEEVHEDVAQDYGAPGRNR